jgi:hypothetical protein
MKLLLNAEQNDEIVVEKAGMSENGIKHPSCGHSAGCNGILGEKSILPA